MWEGVWIAKFLCSSFQRQEAYGNTAVSPDSWLRQLRSDADVKMVEALFTTKGS